MRYVVFDENGAICIAHDEPFEGSIEIDYDVVYVNGKFYREGDVLAYSADIDLRFLSLRGARDMRIAAVSWMRERHADEVLLGRSTTLTEQQYLSLISYIQSLRDLPGHKDAPWDGGGPKTPWPELPKTEQDEGPASEETPTDTSEVKE